MSQVRCLAEAEEKVIVVFGFGPDFCFTGLTALSGIAHTLPNRSAPGTRPSRTYWFTQRMDTPHLFAVSCTDKQPFNPHLFLPSIKTVHQFDTHNLVSFFKLLLYTTSRS